MKAIALAIILAGGGIEVAIKYGGGQRPPLSRWRLLINAGTIGLFFLLLILE